MRLLLLSVVALAALPFVSGPSRSNVDPAFRFAWSENTGWTNWQHDAPEPGDGVIVTATHLSGYVWTENVGWINLGDGFGPYENDPADSATFGVNIEIETGDLFGKGWGENVGWINFDTRNALSPHGQAARLDFNEN